MLRRYRHRPTGALVTSEEELPSREWEPVDGKTAEKAEPKGEQEEKPRRTTRPRKAAASEG